MPLSGRLLFPSSLFHTLMPPSSKPTHVFLDFDGTLTLSSTLPLVATLFPSAPPLTPFTTAYLSDYTSHASTYQPPALHRKTISSELAYLSSLSPIERRSTQRLEHAGIFKHVTWSTNDKSIFRHSAQHAFAEGNVHLRDGIGHLLDLAARNGVRVDVLSVNWSANWIYEVLKAFLGGERLEGVGLRVMANEIEPGGSGRLSRTRVVEGGKYEVYWEDKEEEERKDEDEGGEGLWTAEHKGQVMRDVVEQLHGEREREARRIVYVGDSSTDLECLVKADVGVCVRDWEGSQEQRWLEETLDKIGIRCEAIEDLKNREVQLGAESGGSLWYAMDFNEIADALF